MPNPDWNVIVRFAPLTNPIPTMAIDMKTSITMHHHCPARHLSGKLEVGTDAASASSRIVTALTEAENTTTIKKNIKIETPLFRWKKGI